VSVIQRCSGAVFRPRSGPAAHSRAVSVLANPRYDALLLRSPGGAMASREDMLCQHAVAPTGLIVHGVLPGVRCAHHPAMRPQPHPGLVGTHRAPTVRLNYRKASAAGYWLPATGYRLLATGYRLLATGYWLPATGYRLPATGYRLLATGYRLPAAGYRLPATCCRLLATGYPASPAATPWQARLPATLLR
jgi:hypothetical protein